MAEESAQTTRQRVGRILLAAGIAGAAAALWTHRRYLTVREVRTGGTPEYPDIVPQVFAYSPDEVRSAALHASRSLPGWEVVEEGDGEIHATAGECTCRRRDVRVAIEPVMDGRMAKVSVSSTCEGRMPDLGANARTVRAFQARMRELLSTRGDAGVE